MNRPDLPVLDWQTVQRYSRPAPRYTSYPTVPVWQEADSRLAQEALERATEADAPVSLYLHVPFCERMCLYCGCNVIVAKNYEKVPRYLQALLTELDMVAGRLGSRPLVQLHLGGGTPTFLSPADLERLVQAVLARFPALPQAELGIEIDPVLTNREHMETVRRLGFNRISIGVQDFDEHVQEIIEREQSAAVSRWAFELARELGFASVNLDLMYGLPGQNDEVLQRSAGIAAELGADRIALFGYAHVPWMKPHQRRLEVHGIPTPEARWRMFNAARQALWQAGYQPIGMDHFAKPQDELARAAHDGRLNRNFQGYTVLAPTDVVALGVSAISDIGRTYLQNSHRLSEYLAAIESGHLATTSGLHVTDEDVLRRRVINSLMCNLRLSYPEMGRELGIDIPEHFAEALAGLAPLEEDRLIERSNDALLITELGRPLARNVAIAFDAYAKPPAEGAGPRFSNAV